jgi:hypothetical protein
MNNMESMSKIGIIVLLLTIQLYFLILWDNIHCLRISANKSKHSGNISTYAHFSEVDHISYLWYPRLIFTHPKCFTLKAGESMYIPAKWWHWAKTTCATSAVNYWFNKSENKKPFIFNAKAKFTLDPILQEMASIWYSDDKHKSNQMKVSKFLTSKMDNAYIITLDNYALGKGNSHLKSIMEPYITPPDIIKKISYDFNIWISSGKHDTGLHYDDNDGILQVISGEKTIVLYPPSDTPYLYPYRCNHAWLNTPAIKFRYNSYTMISETTGKPSNHLLYETSKNFPNVLSQIGKFYNKYGPNKLIWGYKKHGDIYRWEFYNYTLDKDPAITSWDVFPDYPTVGPEEHYYYSLNNSNAISLPFWGNGTYKKNDELFQESKIFVIDTYKSFKSNYNAYMDKLGYATISDDFREIILDKYSSYEICIFNKKEGQIFVMYMGLSYDNFIDFLTQNKYEDSLVDHVENNKNNYHITHEVAIVYDIATKKPIRSGFYGIL